MKRLTKRYIDEDDGRESIGLKTGRSYLEVYFKGEIEYRALDKLADYEDTGMTPEQVIEMQMDWVAMKTASETYREEKAERPEMYVDGYDRDGNIAYTEWYCPRCYMCYEMEYGHYNYCPNCGQKIDWSGEDEK